METVDSSLRMPYSLGMSEMSGEVPANIEAPKMITISQEELDKLIDQRAQELVRQKDETKTDLNKTVIIGDERPMQRLKIEIDKDRLSKNVQEIAGDEDPGFMVIKLGGKIGRLERKLTELRNAGDDVGAMTLEDELSEARRVEKVYMDKIAEKHKKESIEASITDAKAKISEAEKMLAEQKRLLANLLTVAEKEKEDENDLISGGSSKVAA